MVLGPTPGEQYLAFVDLPDDDYPAAGQLRRDLDEAIMDAAEQVLAEWRRRDPLLRALLADGAALNTWATYQAGQVPAGTLIRVTRNGNVWEGRATGETFVRYYSTAEVRIDWKVRFGFAEPTITPTAEVEAWVPLPVDLSAVLLNLDGAPAITPATDRPSAQRRSVVDARHGDPPLRRPGLPAPRPRRWLRPPPRSAPARLDRPHRPGDRARPPGGRGVHVRHRDRQPDPHQRGVRE